MWFGECVKYLGRNGDVGFRYSDKKVGIIDLFGESWLLIMLCLY